MFPAVEVILPCSITDLSAIAFRDLGQFGIDALELLVDNLSRLEGQADLLLRLRAEPIIARGLRSIVLSDAFQTLDLVRSCATPDLVSDRVSLSGSVLQGSPVSPGHVPSRLFALSVEQCVCTNAQLTLANLHLAALTGRLLASCLTVRRVL
jgi:hypothetical protein